MFPRRTPILLALIVAMSLALTACGGDSASEADALDVDEDNDSTMDIPDDQPDDTDMTSGSEITFFFQNIGTETVFYQTGFGVAGWLEVQDQSGVPLQISTDCGCPCDQYPNCPVCDIAPPMGAELAPTGELERTWNGTSYTSVDAPDGMGTCLQRNVMPDGTYQARYCWGNDVTGLDFNNWVTGFECDTLEFELGTTRELRKGVSVNAPQPGLNIVLENTSGSPVFIQSGGEDCSGNPSWFNIGDGSETWQLFEVCGLCLCAEGPECGPVACPEACAPPMVQEIPSGETATFEWDGKYELNKSLGDEWMCRDRVSPASPEVTIEVCYGSSYTGSDLSGTVDTPSCETATAILGEDNELVFTTPTPVP